MITTIVLVLPVNRLNRTHKKRFSFQIMTTIDVADISNQLKSVEIRQIVSKVNLWITTLLYRLTTSRNQTGTSFISLWKISLLLCRTPFCNHHLFLHLARRKSQWTSCGCKIIYRWYLNFDWGSAQCECLRFFVCMQSLHSIFYVCGREISEPRKLASVLKWPACKNVDVSGP